MKKLWEVHTPEELAERERPRRISSTNVHYDEWFTEWSIKMKQIKETSRKQEKR